jgi:hypothetical protein
MLSFRTLTIVAMQSLVMVCMVFAAMPKPKSAGSIELISLTPEGGSSVDRGSTITAQLRFTIDNFKDKKDRYKVSINFQERESRAATFSKGPGDMIALIEATGTITLAYPLDRIWDDPRLRKPLVVYFYLHEHTGKRETVVLDTTDGIPFSVRE